MKVSDKQIKERLIEAAEREFYIGTPNEFGCYQVKLPADYRETNEGLLPIAYDERESSDLRGSIINEIHEAYIDYILDCESKVIKTAGFDDVVYRDEVEEILHEYISFDPDYDHFMKDDMKVNLLLAKDYERGANFVDIKHNLLRQINKDEFEIMKADAEKWGNEIHKPDNALVWLVEQQGYTLEELSDVYMEFNKFLNEASNKPLQYSDVYKNFKENHSPFLTSVCQELDNHTYEMGCLTILFKSNLEEYCAICEFDNETKERAPKEIVFSKDTEIGIFNPWNGSGGPLEIELEKDIVLPTELIWELQIEGVKPDFGYTVDDVYGLVGSCWKEAKGILEPEKKSEKTFTDVIQPKFNPADFNATVFTDADVAVEKDK